MVVEVTTEAPDRVVQLGIEERTIDEEATDVVGAVNYKPANIR